MTFYYCYYWGFENWIYFAKFKKRKDAIGYVKAYKEESGSDVGIRKAYEISDVTRLDNEIEVII